MHIYDNSSLTEKWNQLETHFVCCWHILETRYGTLHQLSGLGPIHKLRFLNTLSNITVAVFMFGESGSHPGDTSKDLAMGRMWEATAYSCGGGPQIYVVPDLHKGPECSRRWHL